jgi:hypothetical protein
MRIAIFAHLEPKVSALHGHLQRLNTGRVTVQRGKGLRAYTHQTEEGNSYKNKPPIKD